MVFSVYKIIRITKNVKVTTLKSGGVMEKNTIGFVAFWKASDSWFSETEENKDKFIASLDSIFDEARDKGIIMHGIHDCSWSSEWRYFTYWTSPSVELLEDICRKLVEIGDINHYNIQHHYVGRLVDTDLLQ